MPFSLIVQSGPREAKDETPVFRAASHPEELVSGVLDSPETKTCWDLFQYGKRQSGAFAYLGSRIKNEFHWRSYEEVEQLAIGFGGRLLEMGLVAEEYFEEENYEPARSLRLLGICTENRAEWIIAELACSYYGFTLVPMYDLMRGEDCRHILNQTRLRTVIASAATLEKVVNNNTSDKLQCIVTLDDLQLSEDLLGSLEVFGIQLLPFNKVALGPTTPQPRKVVEPEHVNSVVYTSGTTGQPKGVLLTHGNLVATVCACMRGPLSFATISCADVHFSYLPLSHVFERIICCLATIKGAKIGFYSGKLPAVLEDIAALRPTVFVSVPRLYVRIKEKLFDTVNSKPLFGRTLFLGVVALSKFCSRIARMFPFDLVLAKPRLALGGRVRYMLVGGSKLDPVIQEQFRHIFGVAFLEGYGLTETCGASFVSQPDYSKGSVGGPVPCVEFKLRSNPDLGYDVDAPNRPQGELFIRGPSVSPGYFLAPSETQNAHLPGGWFRSGDIAEMDPTSGTVTIIDRAKDIFKLSQGEYVSPSKVEDAYRRSRYIHEVFVDALPQWDRPRALVWMKIANIREALQIENVWADEKRVKDFLRQDMACHEEGLFGFEKVREFTLAKCPLPSIERGMLTATMKIRRAYIREHGDSLLEERD